jgi:hypothetical protein
VERARRAQPAQTTRRVPLDGEEGQPPLPLSIDAHRINQTGRTTMAEIIILVCAAVTFGSLLYIWLWT